MRRAFPVFLCLLALALPWALTPARVAGQPQPGEPIEEENLDADEAEAAGDEGGAEAEGEEDGDDEEPEWSVEAPPGPSREVPIQVDEGTWMSVDVSPDGGTLVFDLLGDLYTLPVDGGRARALTSGVAWDMQPRFSPDGSEIAFTSDRGGGDNIWVMPATGGEAQAVSEEDFRLLNSAAWSPDGRFIAARKHFTSRRSLGAGEIWLYHRSGGKGLQMIEKPNEQKDLGEPAFSPDGRYLYFSQDTTPGDVFEYNKDSNAEIYTIRRLDRDSGRVEPLVTGPGGAIRPTPSPDGRLLAFLRRVRFQTTLFVRDLESGAEWPLYDGMERDLQETWAVHGVYPQIAWTPDSRAIVFWAEGRLQKIDVRGGVVTEIPFTVDDTRTVFARVISPQTAWSETFDVRMLRWVEVAPGGGRVAYQALGRVWVKDLPDGAPRPLTAAGDRFEHFPTWTPDGEMIVLTTWNDRRLGRVVAVPAGGGAERVLTPDPGHYLEPAVSPDGATVVYRKAAGGGLTSPTWSAEPGLWAVPLAGGAPYLVSREGVRPSFGAASDRVFFMTFEDEDERAFRSIELDGSDERTHLRSAAATEFRLSPDGRWIAFRERFDAYVAPFTPTGQTVELGPKNEALPVTRVSRTAGEYLHWSADSSALHWALGSELFTRDLTDAFAFLPGAPEELPEPPAAGVEIGFESPADVPSGAIAFTGARAITMRGDEVVENATVVVEGNRIVSVRRGGAAPAGATVVDARGKTLLPGLVDVHYHGAAGRHGVVPQRNWYHFAGLAFGVTTTHDPSNDTAEVFAARELALAGAVTAPRIFSTGTILYGAAGDFKAEIDSLADAEKHLERMRRAGAFSVKSYNQPRRDQRQQVLAAARELGMLVYPEGGSLFQHNMTMLVDGHTGIEHSIPLAAVYDDVRQLWPATGVGYTPTLVVGYGGLFGEEYWYATTEVWKNERLATFVPRERLDPRSRRRRIAPDEEWNHVANASVARELAELGVPVQIGAHGQREGLGAHWEIWMLVQGGMTPHRALRAATLDGAAYLGMEAELGSLEPGKLADMVVLDADPLADVRNSESVAMVMVNGRLYDAATMNQIGNHPAERGRLWWEYRPYEIGGAAEDVGAD